jgi:hypothetical protein
MTNAEARMPNEASMQNDEFSQRQILRFHH